MDDAGTLATFLFTDIEGSSRLWEREPVRMQSALATHDAIARRVVEARLGRIVKMTGDGICAVFEDPLAAVNATVDFLCALANPPDGVLELRARCGIHVGIAQLRDHDYFGNTVNRAARIMSAGNGGQVLLSQAVVDLVRGRLPDAITLRDLGQVRLRDLASPERLYQVQHPSLRHDFPALRSLEATPNNLPQQATSFVGRESELEDVRKLLSRTRLLTLVGAGGIGKTRLSLQLAAEVLDDYVDGVWFVELAPIADERLVPHAVATVLGIKDEPGRALAETLVSSVASKRLLLVLDNCEHLLGACASLAERLLRGAAGVRVLAASREPLRIGGETTYPVPALAVPASGKGDKDATYASYPAIRLFDERARAVLPSFRLDAQNGATIAEICRHLDGIPLAIELAAARVRVMPVETIAGRLGDRFRLLTSGNRTALPRQQTLRALIDWSHDLLTEPERVLFRRLSVFAGGWTLESSESVFGGGEESNVLDLLSSLVDKSLVAADVRSGRYGLLETMRQYAAEKLEASGEGEATRDRHLDFHLAFAETAEQHLNARDQASWLARLDAEHENLLAAHAWCDSSSEGGEKGLRLVNAAKAYWFSRGLLPMGKRAVLEALARSGAQRRAHERCVALFGAGQFCSFAGEYDEAIGYLEESLAIARELGDRKRIAATLQPLGFAELGRGRFVQARHYLEEAVDVARAIDDAHQLAAALNAVAQLCRVEGDLAGAEPLYDQVVALGRQLGNANLVAIGLLNITMVYVLRGAHGSARIALQEIVAIADDTHSMPVGQSALEVAAGFASALREYALALRMFGAAEANTHLTGIARDPADDAFLQPLIATAREELGAAAAAAAEQGGHDAGYDTALTEVRAWLQAAPPASRAA
jgi:predicted ATPase/class 3 adenylate cyclase